LSQNVVAQKIAAPLLRTEVRNILLAFLLHVELLISFFLLLVGLEKRELMLKRPLEYAAATDIYNVHNFHLIFNVLYTAFIVPSSTVIWRPY
jgi:hypothetical protein